MAQVAMGRLGISSQVSVFSEHFKSVLPLRYSNAFVLPGTQISVFGTTNVKNSSSGIVDPSWECLIDNNSIGSTPPFLFIENNWNLCSADNLPSGTHTLTVNTFSHGRHFWFDYLQYTPSNVDDLNNALVKVPRTDPDIVYDGTWQNLGNIATMTRASGSSATLSFTGRSWRPPLTVYHMY